MKKVLMLAVMAALCWMTSGCFLLHVLFPTETTVPARVNTEKKSVAFVPMGEGKAEYFDSPLGEEFSLALAEAYQAEMAAQGKKATVVPVSNVKTLIRNRVIGKTQLDKIGDVLGVDYVVVGTIEEFRLREPGLQQGFLGTMKVRVEVFDVATGQIVDTKVHEHKYPLRAYAGTPEVDPDVTESMFRSRMMHYVAQHISYTLFNRKVKQGELDSWRTKGQK